MQPSVLLFQSKLCCHTHQCCWGYCCSIKNERIGWKACTKFRKHATDLENLHQIWKTCTKYGKHAPNLENLHQILENLHQIWKTCTKFGKPAPNLENMHQIWKTCPRFGKSTANLENLLQIWKTCNKFGSYAPDLENLHQICCIKSKILTPRVLKENVALKGRDQGVLRRWYKVRLINKESQNVPGWKG